MVSQSVGESAAPYAKQELAMGWNGGREGRLIMEERESKHPFPESALEEGFENFLVGQSGSLVTQQSFTALIGLGLDVTAVTIVGEIMVKRATWEFAGSGTVAEGALEQFPNRLGSQSKQNFLAFYFRMGPCTPNIYTWT